VYNEVLKHAVRTLFYQRAGHAKQPPYAETAWADQSSHMGDLQDQNARLFSAPNDASTERDLSGGWYDAGDYNKYTNWTADYIVDIMLAFLENPDAFTDDFDIPESGNGLPDLLDEAKWGIDHLLRMQNEDGSVLSIVGLSHASPPSAASGPSRYGPANTSATLNTAAALAISSRVFAWQGLNDYAALLAEKSELAWQWAEDNPAVLFQNNDPEYNSVGLGAGQQEVDDYGRFVAKLRAAAFLFDITGDVQYRNFFDENYDDVHLFQWNFAYPFEADNQDMLLYYTDIEGADPEVSDHIKEVYGNALNNGADNLPAIAQKKDPYRAYIKDYTWGSNGIKCRQGMMFSQMAYYAINVTSDINVNNAAQGYLNYIHGVNPFGMVYLSNMYKYGAKKAVNEFYHSWFADGSNLWDRVGVSVHGPAPGFLTGGANPSYNWDNCCPSNCGSASNNAICLSESISPPKDQPNQKSYKDFNTSWPLNSWSVTENSNGYQIPYIRLLANYVNWNYDCAGVEGGDAEIDICGQCTGGTTGITPETNPDNCPDTYLNSESIIPSPFEIYPNPLTSTLKISPILDLPYQVIIQDSMGRTLRDEVKNGDSEINLENECDGILIVTIVTETGIYAHKILKQ
jgi:hypothetical protein